MSSFHASITPIETRALTGLVAAIGADGFAQSGLTALNAPLQAASWAVYRLRADAPPVLHLSASHQIQDRTTSCFAAYAQGGLYQRDGSFDALRRRTRRAEPVVLRMRAEQAPNDEHRAAIYQAHALLERVSVASLEDDGSLLAVNLYHHEHQGYFSEAEVERFGRLAPVLLEAVRRHVALVAPRPAPTPRERLLSACPALTDRELDVCERLLRGWTHDGIAQDLGLGVTTVKTYRSRAFARLGLHFRSELFARFPAAPATH